MKQKDAAENAKLLSNLAFHAGVLSSVLGKVRSAIEKSGLFVQSKIEFTQDELLSTRKSIESSLEAIHKAKEEINAIFNKPREVSDARPTSKRGRRNVSSVRKRGNR